MKLDSVKDVLFDLDRDADRPRRRNGMVGDGKYDIACAKENNCFSAGVTYGYGSTEELTEAGADFLCPTPTAVAGIISGTHS